MDFELSLFVLRETINHVTLLTSILARQRCLKILILQNRFPFFYSESGDINGIFVGLTVVKTRTEMFVCIRHFQKV